MRRGGEGGRCYAVSNYYLITDMILSNILSVWVDYHQERKLVVQVKSRSEVTILVVLILDRYIFNM